jgi:glyoxylase-like metal-dependent hydrolase (beta-lactamase superfamily II)
MAVEIKRRSFLQMGLAAGAAALLPDLLLSQGMQPDRVAQARANALNTPIKVTPLTGNVYLLQGAGGNMALQTGREGPLLIDSSFATAAPRIREAIAKLDNGAPYSLINTHWHFDHTDGNEAMHAAGFNIVAHRKTRERLSMPQTMKFFGFTLPAAPLGALPTVTFDSAMQIEHNGDELNLLHVEPAHTDTDILIHFRKANVLHVGDLWFNGMYPFIDADSGGSIGGMIHAGEKILPLADSATQIIPGHGFLGNKEDYRKFHAMLVTSRDRVAAIKKTGASEDEAVARKPLADLDAAWGKGMMNGDAFTRIVYATLG